MSAIRLDGPRHLRKQRANVLAPHTKKLLQMEKEKKTLSEMVDWLGKHDAKSTKMSVSRFLSRQREKADFDNILDNIAHCTQECLKIEAVFAENPAPELETIIKIFKVAIMNLNKRGLKKPALLKLSDQLSRTCIGFISSQAKFKFEERKLAIKEQKSAETKKGGQAKALEYCLEYAKAFPEVQEIFQAAFAALKKAKAAV